MFFRPLRRGDYKPWWSTIKSDEYGAHGLAVILIAKCLGEIPFPTYANDRDHCRW